MKFNIDDYKGRYAMHCKTKKESKDFCKCLHNFGRTWVSGHAYTEFTFWSIYNQNTCYAFNEGMFCGVNYYKKENYKILEWSDFMEKKFTKSDLKTGDVVLRRNNDVEIVFLELGSLVGKDGYNLLSKINKDLTSPPINCGGHDWDIIAVRRPKKSVDCQFCAFEYKFGELVYERKDEPEEMTLKEICETLGKEIKIVKEH